MSDKEELWLCSYCNNEFDVNDDLVVFDKENQSCQACYEMVRCEDCDEGEDECMCGN